MLRTKFVRRAGRLLGAVTVTGVLSLGVLAASPVAAHAGSFSGCANGIGASQGHVRWVTQFEANGI